MPSKDYYARRGRALYQKRYKADPEYRARCRAASLKARSSWPGRIRALLTSAKRRARLCGITFDLTAKWLAARLEAQGYRCAVTGAQMVLDRPGSRAHHPMAPSLDRVDNAGPYSRKNTRVVCWWYNRHKADGTDEEALELARQLVQSQS